MYENKPGNTKDRPIEGRIVPLEDFSGIMLTDSFILPFDPVPGPKTIGD